MMPNLVPLENKSESQIKDDLYSKYNPSNQIILEGEEEQEEYGAQDDKGYEEPESALNLLVEGVAQELGIDVGEDEGEIPVENNLNLDLDPQEEYGEEDEFLTSCMCFLAFLKKSKNTFLLVTF